MMAIFAILLGVVDQLPEVHDYCIQLISWLGSADQRMTGTIAGIRKRHGRQQ